MTLFASRKRKLDSIRTPSCPDVLIDQLLDKLQTDYYNYKTQPVLPSSSCSWCGERQGTSYDDDQVVCENCAAVDRDRIISSEYQLSSVTQNPSSGMSKQIKLPYQRIIYFREYLRQRQGLSLCCVPVKIVYLINRYVTILKRVAKKFYTAETLCRKLLHSHGLSYYAEHSPTILWLQNIGYRPLALSSYQEKLLVDKYKTMSAAHERITASTGVKHSMLNNNFFCYMVARSCGWTSTYPYWRLSLKKPTLAKQLRMWNTLIKYS